MTFKDVDVLMLSHPYSIKSTDGAFDVYAHITE